MIYIDDMIVKDFIKLCKDKDIEEIKIFDELTDKDPMTRYDKTQNISINDFLQASMAFTLTNEEVNNINKMLAICLNKMKEETGYNIERKKTIKFINEYNK